MQERAPRLYFLSFADSRMQRAAANIKKQAEDFGLFDDIIICDESLLPAPDSAPWAAIFSPSCRGFGYWAWKPYLIRQVMARIAPGDMLLYCDAGCYLNPKGRTRFHEYLQRLQESPCGMLAFDASQGEGRIYLERQWCKSDVFVHFGCAGRKDILNTPQVAATQIMVRCCPEAMNLLDAWNQTWMNDLHMIDDSPSVAPNAEDFQQHRHDQSLFSVLYKLSGAKALPYNEKYSDDWDMMQQYPLWAMRDRGRRLRPFLRVWLYIFLSLLPFCGTAYRAALRAYLKRRPYMRPYVPPFFRY